MAKKYLELKNILKSLLFEKNMRPTELAKKTNVSDANIHRILTGESTNPFKSTTQPIADFFGINVNQLLGIDPLPSNIYKNRLIYGERNTQIVPLLDWGNLGVKDKLLVGKEELIVMNVGYNAFAVKNPDYSMETLFQKGTILIFDPDKEAKDRSYGLIKLYDQNCYIFRQILIDLERQHIKALNPDIGSSSLRLLSKCDRVIAILVESRNMYE